MANFSRKCQYSFLRFLENTISSNVMHLVLDQPISVIANLRHIKQLNNGHTVALKTFKYTDKKLQSVVKL